MKHLPGAVAVRDTQSSSVSSLCRSNTGLQSPSLSCPGRELLAGYSHLLWAERRTSGKQPHQCTLHRLPVLSMSVCLSDRLTDYLSD